MNTIGRESEVATTSKRAGRFVTITDRNHPYYGQQFMVVGAQRGKDPKILVQLPDGRRVRIPQKWTDYAQPSSNSSALNNTHLLDLNGLFKIIKMINRLKEEGNF